MAQQDEGIMALMGAGEGAVSAPQDASIDMKEFRREAYPVLKDSVREVDPDGFGEMQATLSSELAQEGEMDLESLEQLLEIVDYINDNPAEYVKVREALIAADIIDADDFPPEMDVEYFATMETVLQEALMRQRGEAAEMVQGPAQMMPPQGFAKGGLADAAQLVASKGRYGDTMLAHITPSEARLLKARGGSGTINPETGLPEFFVKKIAKGIKKRVKSIGKVVKKVAASPVGRIAMTVGLSMVGVPAPVASALVTKAGGGSWKDALKAGAVAYLAGPTSPIAKGVQGATPFLNSMNPALATGLRSGLTGTGAALLTGAGLKEAVTSGLTAGLTSGIQAAATAPAAAPVAAPAAAGTGADVIAGAAPAADLQPRALDDFSTGAAPTPPVSTASSRFADFTQTPEANFTPVTAPSAASSRFADFTQGAPVDAGGIADVTPSFFDQAKSFYNENLSPSGIRAAGEGAAQDAGMKAMQSLQERLPTATPAMLDSAYQAAYKNAMPGTFAQYAPLVGAGLGAMALTGGFSPKDADKLPEEDMLRRPMDIPATLRRPIQNLPGVTYDAAGNITGSQAFNPYANMQPTEVATPGIMSLSSGRPQGFNAGGIAGLAGGGYPRRIGQIDGPGTETSDDIPAMLSDGEFVMTARAVRGAGNGSRREGAKRMYAMMHQLEKNAARG
jgi:hypothetical protein